MKKIIVITIIFVLVFSCVSFAEIGNLNEENIPVSTDFLMNGDDLSLCKIVNWTDIVQFVIEHGTMEDTAIGLRSDGTVVIAGNLVTMGGGEKREVEEWEDIIKVASSGQHIVGLKSNGTVVVAGDSKIIGKDTTYMAQTSKWKDIIDIAAGEFFAIGLKSDGTVLHSLDLPDMDVSNWKDIVKVKSDSFTIVGLKSNGTLEITGSIKGLEDALSWTDIKDIDVDFRKIVGLKNDGSVVMVNADTTYEDKNYNIDDWNNIVSISAGERIAGLRSDGRVFITGTEEANEQTKHLKLNNIKNLHFSSGYIYGITDQGNIWTNAPLINEMKKNNNTVKIARLEKYPNDDYVLLNSNGKVRCLSNNQSMVHVIEKWDNIIDIKSFLCGSNYAETKRYFDYGIIGLKSDGSIVIYPEEGNYNNLSSDWKDIIQIDSGKDFVVGLKKDGSVVGEGIQSRYSGIEDWKDIVQVSAHFAHIIGLKKDGTVVAVADTGHYNNASINLQPPINISDWSEIKNIATSTRVTAGVKGDGTVIVCGLERAYFDYDEFKDWNNIIQVYVDYDRLIGLRSDGTVVATGMNEVDGHIRARMFGWDEVYNWKDVKKIYFEDGSITGYSIKPQVLLDGKKLELSIDPIVLEGRTLVPLRSTFEALGASVEWNEGNKTVTAYKGDIEIKLSMDSRIAYKNDEEIEKDVPVSIVDSRTLVPVTFIAESLGVDVQWDKDTKTVIINTAN